MITKQYNFLVLLENNIEYEVRYSRGMRLTIKFNREGKLIISFPKGMKEESIETFLESHLKWIQERYHKQTLVDRKFETGETYLFMGKNYQIELITSRHEEVILTDTKLYIYHLETTNVMIMMKEWEKNQAETILSTILYQCFEQMKDELRLYPKLIIKKSLSHWGSCTPSKNEVMLNIALIHVPFSIIEYVVFHELCHYHYLNHSSLFHQYLEKYVPDERKRKKALRDYRVDYK
jgi:predicted metal-dependent hydrolase